LADPKRSQQNWTLSRCRQPHLTFAGGFEAADGRLARRANRILRDEASINVSARHAVTLKVFLVDDLLSTRTLIVELLNQLGGFDVAGSAVTEAEAKLWLDENPGCWDVLIVDLVLQEGSGMSLVSHSKRLRPQAKVVVFSAYASPGIREHCLALGADAVFDKAEAESFTRWVYEELANRRE
jgi:CheY-like chemotaxis protein